MRTDLYVIGGTVGTRWGGPVGWAAYAYVTATKVTKKLVDSTDVGQLPAADVLPFAAAIQWWHDTYNLDGLIVRPQVTCVTDSPGIVATGKSPDLRTPDSDWRFITWFEQRGYRIGWTWELRDEQQPILQEARAAFDAHRSRAPAGVA